MSLLDYDQQFKDRIRHIGQGGNAPPPSGGGSGCGVAAVWVGIAIGIACLRGIGGSRTESIPTVRFEMPKIEMPKFDFRQQDIQNRELERILREMRAINEQDPLIRPVVEADQDAALRRLMERLRRENPDPLDPLLPEIPEPGRPDKDR